jgi:hypothetical protein
VNRDAAFELARRGSLYPSVILHGGDAGARRDAALGIARILLCERPAAERPCGACRHCRRLAWSGGEDGGGFHPDFQVLERDLKTSTSVEATRALLRAAQVAPFEARGQVFVLAAADTLSGEAADSLLKALEEPGTGAPRHFLLLAPSQYDLLPTLRSRSLAVYLGPAAALGEAEVAPVADAVAAALAGWAEGGGPVLLLAAAEALLAAADAAGESWGDPRASRPWSLAAAAVVRAARGGAAAPLPRRLRRPLLELAAALLEAPPWRLRGVPAERLVEGLVFRHLAVEAGGP